MMLRSGAAEKIEQDEFSRRFPTIEPKFKPVGNRVLVQMRYPVNETKGGIALSDDVVGHAYHNEQIALVLDMGGGCFKFATSGEDWPPFLERYAIGDCVRVPLHGGDNQWRIGPNNTFILLKIFKDHEIMGVFDREQALEIPTNYAYF